MNSIKVEYTSTNSICLVITYCSLLIYPIGYVFNGWWMSICAFFVMCCQVTFWSYALGQTSDRFGTTFITYKKKTMDFCYYQFYLTKLKLKINKYLFHYIILSILDLFPFFAKDYKFLLLFDPDGNIQQYEGGIITTIIVVLTLILNFTTISYFMDKNKTLAKNFVRIN